MLNDLPITESNSTHDYLNWEDDPISNDWNLNDPLPPQPLNNNEIQAIKLNDIDTHTLLLFIH